MITLQQPTNQFTRIFRHHLNRNPQCILASLPVFYSQTSHSDRIMSDCLCWNWIGGGWGQAEGFMMGPGGRRMDPTIYSASALWRYPDTNEIVITLPRNAGVLYPYSVFGMKEVDTSTASISRLGARTNRAVLVGAYAVRRLARFRDTLRHLYFGIHSNDRTTSMLAQQDIRDILERGLRGAIDEIAQRHSRNLVPQVQEEVRDPDIVEIRDAPEYSPPVYRMLDDSPFTRRSDRSGQAPLLGRGSTRPRRRRE